MPRAEVGSTKYLNNKLKSKGLQRLRFFCQVCEKQCRDENGFKCHTQSESHFRNMQLISGNTQKVVADYGKQFERDFLQLLRTSHGEKPIHINVFYQQYISNKEHVHMNATQWQSLTMFAKYLGQQGICRVEEREGKGIFISWIDNSPEALRRQAAIQKRERQDKGDELRELKAIEEQADRAAERLRRMKMKTDSTDGGGLAEPPKDFKFGEGGKVKFSFKTPENSMDVSPKPEPPAPKKARGVFAIAKANALANKKVAPREGPKMSEAERIMKEEMGLKRSRNEDAAPRPKRARAEFRTSD